MVNGWDDPWVVAVYRSEDMTDDPELAQQEDVDHCANRDIAALAGVNGHAAEAVSIPAAFDHGEVHCEMNPCEEAADHNETEGAELVEACIARQVAFAVQVEVDFDDHVCQIHVMLHKMVKFSDPQVRGPSRSSHGRERL